MTSSKQLPDKRQVNRPESTSNILATGQKNDGLSKHDSSFSDSFELQRVMADPHNLTPANVLGLQKTIGNRAVMRLLSKSGPARSSVASKGPGNGVARQTLAGQIQRRIENPFAQSGTHGEWSTTAHHILPYSELTKDLNAVKKDLTSYRAVYKAAIPDVLTKEMLKNVKANVADSDEARSTFRDRLVSDEDGSVEKDGMKLDDIRESFILWMGGNQFQGPNTSIRSEPGAKEGLDYDAKYFTDYTPETFKKLTDLGDNLGKNREDAGATSQNLIAILNITKNVKPKVFNPAEWFEVTSLKDLNDLHADKKLGRAHLVDYAYFKMANDAIGKGSLAAFAEISGGKLTYEGIEIPSSTAGTFKFIKVSDSQQPQYKVDNGETSTAVKFVADKNVPSRAEKGSVFLTKTADLSIVEAKGGKKSLKLGDFPDLLPVKGVKGEEIELIAGMFNGRKLKKDSTAIGLYDYIKDKLPVSTFLPKALYDELKAEKVKEETPTLPTGVVGATPTVGAGVGQKESEKELVTTSTL